MERREEDMKPTNRHWIVLAVVLVLAVVVSACGNAATSTTEPTASDVAATAPATSAPAEPRTVGITADGFLLGSQAWVALDRGFFDEENLDVKVSVYGTGIEAIQAVIARQADLGPALDFAVLNLAAAAANNMRVVGAIAAPKPGFHSLAVQNDINGPQDLVGKTIGYVPGTAEHYVTIQYLLQNGIALESVKLVPLPGLFELVGALRTNEIQAAWTWLSGSQEAEADENLKLLTDDSDVLDTSAIYLVAGAEWAAENQDIIIGVLRAYDKASKVLNAEPEAAAQIVADAVSGDAATFAKIIPNQRFAIGFTDVQLESFDAIARFLIDTGKLPADFDIRDFLDFEAMEIAVPGSVTADLGR